MTPAFQIKSRCIEYNVITHKYAYVDSYLSTSTGVTQGTILSGLLISTFRSANFTLKLIKPIWCSHIVLSVMTISWRVS